MAEKKMVERASDNLEFAERLAQGEDIEKLMEESFARKNTRQRSNTAIKIMLLVAVFFVGGVIYFLLPG